MSGVHCNCSRLLLKTWAKATLSTANLMLGKISYITSHDSLVVDLARRRYREQSSKSPLSSLNSSQNPSESRVAVAEAVAEAEAVVVGRRDVPASSKAEQGLTLFSSRRLQAMSISLRYLS